MENNNNINNSNNKPFFELLPDVFKDLSPEEKKNHKKYALASFGQSALMFIFNFILISNLTKISNIKQGFLSGIYCVLLGLMIMGCFYSSMQNALSELQINKNTLSKFAFLISIFALIVNVIIIIIAYFIIF